MFMKRLIAGLLAVLLCFALVACDDPDKENETTESTSDSTSASESTSDSTSASESTSDSTSESTSDSEKPGNPEQPGNPGTPVLPAGDLETVKVGQYVTLRYNAVAADVSYEAKKGIGSRENITLTVTPKNGYIFNGWSVGDAMVNGKTAVSNETT